MGGRLLKDAEAVGQAERAKKVATKPKKDSRAKTEKGKGEWKGRGVAPVVAVVAMTPSPGIPRLAVLHAVVGARCT